ncbi:MAG: hypothetical protein R3F34_09610 [Planctomycetota bacterium]
MFPGFAPRRSIVTPIQPRTSALSDIQVCVAHTTSPARSRWNRLCGCAPSQVGSGTR